jgi:predicted ATPase/class 3 adenylate cyclase
VSDQLDRRLVAVMFTDMVGYTALMQADERLGVDKRDRYMRVLERHHDAFGGTIIQRLGDGSMSMFPSSLAAVLAAIAIQRELASQDIPARIGVHVGEVIVEPERLTGDAVNIAARIESFAVPGGVMLSDSAYDQIKNRSDVWVVHLGRFRLKNVGRPFELYAVSGDGVVVPDPAELEGKGERFASLPSNLPEPVTQLVGRAADLASLIELAREHPVVTITGPGGVGKTRIVIELGRMLTPEFLDGVAFVALADVNEPADFLPALADALDVKEAEERTLGEGIVSLIGDKKALLLLDNLEQVVLAATEVAGLAQSCPGLRIVTTSRTPLRIAVEREYPLAPLALPPPPDPDSTDSLITYSAVALFVERARTTKGSFELTPENAGVVAAICRRLDGLPLAIELATARLRLLSPEALLERLDHALDVLTSGARDTPERQQTLRATIDWSHSLLDEKEQRLFRRLAVFAGGCTLADLEAVCADLGESVLDELESLVDKALVQADGQSERLRMLQTIGEFARERLEASGEVSEIPLRHARRYAARAQEIRGGIEGADQVRSLERGIAEEGNLQAALDTLLAGALDGDAGASEEGMQLCGDLWMYWHIRGKHLTAREYTASFLDADVGGSPTAGRADALITAGLASWALGSSSGRTTNGSRRIASRQNATPIASSASVRSCRASGCSDPISKPASGGRARASRGVAPSASPGLRGLPRPSTASSTQSRATSTRRRRGTPRRSRSSSGSETRRERACRSAASPGWRPVAVIWPAPSTSTGSLSPHTKRSVTEPRKPGSSPRWPGRISGTKTLHSHARPSSTRCSPTPMWRAFVESGSR